MMKRLLLSLFAAVALALPAWGQIPGPGVTPSYTWAGKPPTGQVGQLIRISNAGTRGSLWMWDGARWKPVSGCTALASLDTASAAIPNSDTVAFQYLIPAGLVSTGDRLFLTTTMIKSGNLQLCPSAN